MFISRINYNSYRSNNVQARTKTQSVNFQGAKNLQPIDINSFKKDGTKLLYGKIKKYLQIIGNIGKIENITLNKSEGIYLSINKNIDKTNILIKNENNQNLMNANFNKDGQMIVGDLGGFHFERTGKNKRTLQTPRATYSPHGYDDREFGSSALDIMVCTPADEKNYAPYRSLYELFIEFTRLHTSIFK